MQETKIKIKLFKMKIYLYIFLNYKIKNKTFKFGGEGSVRTAGASVPSHVSVKRRRSNLLSKITSFIKKVLFKRVTLQSAMLMVTGGLLTEEVDCSVRVLGLLKFTEWVWQCLIC